VGNEWQLPLACHGSESRNTMSFGLDTASAVADLLGAQLPRLWSDLIIALVTVIWHNAA